MSFHPVSYVFIVEIVGRPEDDLGRGCQVAPTGGNFELQLFQFFLYDGTLLSLLQSFLYIVLGKRMGADTDLCRASGQYPHFFCVQPEANAGWESGPRLGFGPGHDVGASRSLNQASAKRRFAG